MTGGHPARAREAGGFGGWLLVLTIFQTLLVVYAGGKAEHFGSAVVVALTNPDFSEFLNLWAGRFGIYFSFLVLLGVVTILMVRRRASFRVLFRVEMAAFVVLPIVDWSWIAIVPWPARASFSLAYPSQSMVLLVAFQSALAIAWLAYEERSKRVSSTFVVGR
jgi:hypothetical protein